MRREISRVILISILAISAPISVYYYFRSKGCVANIARSTEIFGTNWLAETEVMDCGFGIGSPVAIVAVNKESGSIIEIATGSDVGFVKIRSVTPKRLDLIVPNRSQVEIKAIEAKSFSINIEYTPQDDPQDRKMYLAWIHDRTDETNRIWYCKNVLSGIPEKSREILDASIAYTYYTPPGSRTHYCNDGKGG